MTSETQQKKQVQVLQRCIVNALEDVKAIDIQVFNTEHLSSLFERVIVASGNSNRQTKALASSVRDDVRETGFDKPRIEGEENGEWIIVDCGAAVVHIMQPAIRAYYRLEEIWGDKPVKLRSAAPVKPSSTSTSTSTKATKDPSAKATVKSTPKNSPVSKAKKPAAGKSAANAPQSTRKSTTAVKKASSSANSTPVKRAAASTKPTATPKVAAAKKSISTAPRRATPKSSNSAARPTRKTSPK